MSFSSLTSELDAFFDTELNNLPAEQRARVERDFSPWKWAGMSPSERRNIATRWDFENDPSTALNLQHIQNNFAEDSDLEMQKAYWQSRSDLTSSDAEIKQAKLVPILVKLVELAAERRNLRGDDPNTAPIGKPLGKESVQARGARLLLWFDEEVTLSGKHGATERVFDRQKILNPKADRSDIGKQIRKAQADTVSQKQGSGMFAQLGSSIKQRN